MYANYVQIVVRRSASEFDDEPTEVIAVRVDLGDGTLDADAVTQATRRWLLEGRHSRFLIDERRRYADVGAEAASVEYVLTLLASGVIGVALQETANFIKAKVTAQDDDREFRLRRFRETSTEDLRRDALRDAERALDLGRGELDVLDLERDSHEVRLRAQRRSDKSYYRIVCNADQTIRIRKLS
jgi:hypothetical protein